MGNKTQLIQHLHQAGVTVPPPKQKTARLTKTQIQEIERVYFQVSSTPVPLYQPIIIPGHIPHDIISQCETVDGVVNLVAFPPVYT